MFFSMWRMVILVVVVILQQWSTSANEDLSKRQLASVMISFQSSVSKITATSNAGNHFEDPSVITMPIKGNDVIENTNLYVVTAPIIIESFQQDPITFQCSRGVVVNEASQMSFVNYDESQGEVCHRVTTSELADPSMSNIDTESQLQIAGEAINDWLIPALKKKHFKMTTPLLRIHSAYMRRNPGNKNEYMASIVVTDRNTESSFAECTIDQQWVVFCSVLIRRSEKDHTDLLDPTHLPPQCTAMYVRQGQHYMQSERGAKIAYPPQFSRHLLPSNEGNVILHDPQNPQRPLSPPPTPRPRPQSLTPSPIRSRSPSRKRGPMGWLPRIPLKPKSKSAQTKPSKKSKPKEPKRKRPLPRLPFRIPISVPKWIRRPFKRSNKPSKHP